MKKLAACLLSLLSSVVAADEFDKRDRFTVAIESAFYNSDNWSKQEKLAFTVSVIGHVADLYTTLNSNTDSSVIPYCQETNPLLGDNPPTAALVSVKLAAIGFEYWLYNSPRFDSNKTPWFGYTSAVINLAAAYSNTQNDCYGVN